jgi:hypothetical protein
LRWRPLSSLSRSVKWTAHREREEQPNTANFHLDVTTLGYRGACSFTKVGTPHDA